MTKGRREGRASLTDDDGEIPCVAKWVSTNYEVKIDEPLSGPPRARPSKTEKDVCISEGEKKDKS